MEVTKNILPEIEALAEGLNESDINDLLNRWAEAEKINAAITIYIEYLKNNIKNYLKERMWDSYKDNNSKINVTLTKIEKKTIDTTQLKNVLSESQLAQITKISVYDKLLITTPEKRKRMKKYVQKKI